MHTPDMPCPEFCPPEVHAALDLAMTRYLHLCGLCDASKCLPSADLKSDRERFGYMGAKYYPDDDDAIVFLHAITGTDPEACMQWLDSHNEYYT